MVLNLIGIILFFADGSDFMRKEMPIRELLISSPGIENWKTVDTFQLCLVTTNKFNLV